MPNLESLELFNVDYADEEPTTDDFLDGTIAWYEKKFPGIAILRVNTAQNIRDVVSGAGLDYESGNGFFEIEKKATIPRKNPIYVIHKITREIFSGARAYNAIGQYADFEVEIHPQENFVIFLQITKENEGQILSEGTRVLYVENQKKVLENWNIKKGKAFPKGKKKQESGDDKDDEEDDDNEDEDEEEGEEDDQIVPINRKLKSIKLHSHSYDIGAGYVLALIQSSPNLQKFKYVYHCPPDGPFLDMLGKKCPKLTHFYIAGDEGSTPTDHTFSDEDIVNFFKNAPQLEEASFKHSSGISGTMFRQLGSVAKNLRKLVVYRESYQGDLVEEDNDIVIGGDGVCSHLRKFSILGFENISSNFKYSVLEKMPSLTSFQFLSNPSAESIQPLLDLIDALLPKLECLCVEEIPDKDNLGYKKLVDAILKAQKNLRKLSIPIQIPWQTLTSAQFPNISKLEVQEYLPLGNSENISALQSIFPNVVSLKLGGVRDSTIHYDVTKWKNLRKFISDALVVGGHPLLITNEEIEIEASSDSPDTFYKLWLYSDKGVIKQ